MRLDYSAFDYVGGFASRSYESHVDSMGPSATRTDLRFITTAAS